MTGRFDWQTEDDSTWAEPDIPRPNHRRRRLLSTAFIVALFVIGILFGLYRLGQLRVAQREQVVKSEVRAAHATWRQAVLQNDLELLTALSTRDDPLWYANQRRLLLAGRLFDRSPFGLTIAALAPPEPEIDVSADMATAELHYRQPYVAVSGTELPPIYLEQTAVYERKGTGWVQRQLTPDEWGATRQHTSLRIVATFPARDQAFVSRLTADLDRDLGDLCGQAEAKPTRARSALCDPEGRIQLDFITNPAVLLALAADQRPALSGRTFRLPAPTLVGLPVDSAGYELLYRGYTDRILKTLRQVAALPSSLPSQNVASLCFASDGSGLELSEYNPTDDRWLAQTSNGTYRSLQPMPDDSGLILRAGLPGIDLDRLDLTLDRDGREQPLLDVGEPQLTASLAAFVANNEGDGLVLRFGHGSTGVADYSWVPMKTCQSGQSCSEIDLAGFPMWSPDGDFTLISDVGQLLVGDSQARPQVSLGAGFSPFWLSPSVFGYVALATLGDSADMRVMLQSVSGDERVTIADSAQLMHTIEPDTGGRLRIRYAMASPTDPSLILIGGSPVGSESAEYLILGIRLRGDLKSPEALEVERLEILLRLPDAPVGDPATYTPTGSPPFTVSKDGRWLVVVRFTDPYVDAWELSLVDLASHETQVITTNFPPYPAQYPFFDWSADAQWLVLVDNGFMRLVSPAYGYERIVPHDYRTCTYTAWVNR